jgi:cytochrome b561
MAISDQHAADSSLTERYTRPAVILHWLIAVLIITNIVFALMAEDAPEENIRFLYDTHKSIGITVFGLVIMRILWRLTHRPPALPAEFKPWEKTVSQWTHGILYFIMVFMPVSGWLHDSAWKAAAEVKLYWFNLFELPRLGFLMAMEPAAKEAWHDILGEAHEIGAYALFALVILHVAGALKYQFIDKQRELQRMW